ncbi:MAG: hypothetical protein ISR96_11245 [Nitrospira sp.]|nr:hypothetical protein [Nitrospira sp.]
MALVVNSNIASTNAQKNLGTSQSKLNKSLERLSSGLRINRASDDAAGLAIATKLSAQAKGLQQAARNSNNAITLVQTAEGGLNTVDNILQRLRELAVQSASDDNTSSDRSNLSQEASTLTAELTRQANASEYNTNSLLDGSFKDSNFQVGANFGQKITFTISDARGKSIGGRAEFSANIADGVTNATNGNFGASEVKLNTYGVESTSSTDDQFSVLEIQAGGLASSADVSNISGTVSLTINNTEVVITVASVAGEGMSAARLADTIVSAINGAKITNVSAYAMGSVYVLKATKGADLELGLSAAATSGTFADGISLIGMNNASTMFGSAAVSGSDVLNSNGASSAIAKSVAINAVKNSSGVTATAQSNVVTADTAVAAATINSGEIYINGVNIGGVSVTASDSTGALVSAINDVSSSTGVTGTTDANGKLVLTAADGRNISLSTKNSTISATTLGMTAAQFTNNTAVFRSAIQLNDDQSFEITGSLGDLYASTTNAYTETGDASKSVAVDQSSFNIASMSINTQADAEAAILTIDAALDDVNSARAEIGAIQNRLEFTVANLEIANENTLASESRIRDADFASETATFTRSQILTQAATAILAQANTLPQLALQLLG